MSSVAVFDRQLAIQRCYGSEQMVRELAGSFLCEMDRLFPEMQAALAGGDLEEVGRLGHRLKGTLVYLGAAPAKEAAFRVEQFATHGGTQAAAEEAVLSLRQQCAILKAALVADPAVAPSPAGE